MRTVAIPDKLGEALVVWTGFGETPTPSRDEQRVVRRFGAETAAELMPSLRRLEQEFYESDAYSWASDLAAAGTAAAARFHGLHPELSSAAVQALAWCYTFDWK